MTAPDVAAANGGLAVLTGVSRRGQVGEVVARTLGEAGYILALLDRDGVEAEARAAELRDAGLRATAHACDLTDADALGAVAASLATVHSGGARALVCLAGGFGGGTVADTDLAMWQKMIAINLTTAHLTTRAFLPMLRAARGSIVYFASAAVTPGESGKGITAYAAAKAGVATLMRAVADEERGAGVRANALAPTAIRTAANTSTMRDSTVYVERETVAGWVKYLCAPESGPISGQLIKIG
ncbi:MAG: SDR family oxidoreductase [Gemmatimonadaceae bacterium]